MTDYDIERCREYKFFSLGNIIFYLIYFAAALAAINDHLIDQFLDLSVSSVWLAFLLVNTKVYAFSRVLLISVYVTIGAILAYNFYVIIPSLRKARIARAAKVRAALDFQRTTRSVKNRGNDVRRSCHLLFDRMMAYIGYLATYKQEMKREREIAATLHWCGMNRSNQMYGGDDISVTSCGYTSPSLSSGSFRQSPYRRESLSKVTFNTPLQRPASPAVRTSPIKLMHNKCGIPLHILIMRSTGESVRGERMESILVHRQPITDSEQLVEEVRDMPVVTSANRRYMGSYAREFQAQKEIICSTDLILTRMLARHLSRGNKLEKNSMEDSHISIFDQCDGLKSFVLLSELLELLSYCWDCFCPSTNLLTEEERKEVDESLIKLLRRSVRANANKDETAEINESGMTFNAFAIWFEETVSNYLLTHETSTGAINMMDCEGDMESDDDSPSDVATMTNFGSETNSDFNYELHELNEIISARNYELETALEGALVVKENSDHATDDESCAVM